MSAESIGTSLLLGGVAVAVLGLVLLGSALMSLTRARAIRFVFTLLVAGAVLGFSAALATLGVGLQGFRLLTQEDVAARIIVQPLGPQHFSATVHFPDGRELPFDVTGDEIYIDAHVLKWKPFANLLGLHTAYELDRIGGRYRNLDQERGAARSVYSLSHTRLVDIFELRQRYAFLEPVLDAQYGSATFTTVKHPATLEVRVSATGLLVRETGAASP